MDQPLAIQPFLDQVVRWAGERLDLQAVVLVGSYARDQAGPDSDIDLVLLVDQPQLYLSDTSWAGRFGHPLKQQVEEYGKVTSLRVWYAGGPEVEFGLAAPDWAALPLDAGTNRVLTAGARVLFERKPLVSPLLD